MADKTVTFVNNTKNPQRMRNADGEIVMVPIGSPVEVSAADAVKFKDVRGFVDASKYIKPSSEVDALKKENADLKEQVKKLNDKIVSLLEELKKKK